MIDIPIDAHVECRDGHGGTSVAIIVNPQTRTVASIVVNDMSAYPAVQRVVPIDRIAETEPDTITLDCTQAELQAMHPFVEIRYVEQPDTSAGIAHLPAVYSVDDTPPMAVETEHLQRGELALQRGADAAATDGVVGTIKELLISPSTGAITHVVVRSGGILRRKERAVPVSAIDTIVGDTIRLKLDRRAVGQLPAVPTKRTPAITRMAAGTTELVLLLSDRQDTAETALRAIQQAEPTPAKLVRAAAVVEKNGVGQVLCREDGDVSARQGAEFGLAAGALLSLLGPAGLLAGAIAGGVTGGLAAKAIDSGVPDASLQGIASLIKEGGSALLLQVDRDRLDRVLELLEGFDGTIEHRPIAEDLVRRTLTTLESKSVE